MSAELYKIDLNALAGVFTQTIRYHLFRAADNYEHVYYFKGHEALERAIGEAQRLAIEEKQEWIVRLFDGRRWSEVCRFMEATP